MRLSKFIMTVIALASGEKSEPVGVGLSLIEHLRASGDVACRNPNAPILFGRDNTAKKAICIRANCKMWSCPTCGARKALQWVARVVNGLNVLAGNWYFVTLTAHEYHRRELSLDNLRKGWKKLYDRIRRAFGSFEYVKIFEQHEDGSYHLHFIANVEMPYTETKNDDGKTEYKCRWLKDNARGCGMGYMTDYQPLKSPAGGAYYIAKYLTKSIGDEGKEWEKGVRRAQTSQGFPKLPNLAEDSELEWSYVSNAGDMFLKSRQAETQGFTLYHPEGGTRTSADKLLHWFNAVKERIYENENEELRN